jgi:hypothetical protein
MGYKRSDLGFAAASFSLTYLTPSKFSILRYIHIPVKEVICPLSIGIYGSLVFVKYNLFSSVRDIDGNSLHKVESLSLYRVRSL